MSRNRLILVTLGVMFSLFMAAVESTVVSTAMPTIVSQLGGLAYYSWVFSAYQLTATTTVPIYGKLSDLYGRRPIFFIAMAIFLAGSVLSGQAQNMDQLIAFRGLQGLGAGGLQPLAFIIIGDIFSFEQRARMQGLFSGVWGVASIVGPLLGGFLVDQVSWHWVFYVNLVPGAVAALLFALAWQEPSKEHRRVSVDYAGSFVLTAGVVALLLALFELGTPVSYGLLALALVLFVVLYVVETRASDPVLPLRLYRDRLFAVSSLHGLFAGWAVFGSASFVPLFAQAVVGVSATAAGSTLMPQLLGWVLASIIGTRLLLRFGYRTIAVIGMLALVAGSVLMTQIGVGTSLAYLMVSVGLMGAGMGLSIPAFMIAVQTAVPRPVLGAATAGITFSRSMGGTLGVSVMGVVLSSQLAASLRARGLDPTTVDLARLIDPVAGAAAQTLALPVRAALAGSIRDVFIAALVAALLALLASILAPRGRIRQAAAPSAAPTRLPTSAVPVEGDE